MKCIVRQNGLIGGAPRSIFQHIIALKTLYYKDIECMTHNNDDQLMVDFDKEVNQMVLRTSPGELCNHHKYISAFREYLWEYRYIKQKKPDLVIALGQIIGALYSDLCEKLGIPLIIYIPGGEIRQHDPYVDLWHDCEVICFSLENADAITKHFSTDHTNIISNRIDIQNRFQDFEIHYMSPQTEVNLLIVSRLDSNKIQSIYSVLSVLSKCAAKDLIINVRIAGKGSNQEDLSVFCDALQTDFLKIQMLGQVHHLTEQFRWAHVVAGKGRSVIEPIMMNRLGCIIGEDGKIEFSNQKNFENLYHYNFSGRNLSVEDSYTEMREMLIKIRKGQISKDFVLETADMAIQQYSTEFLPDKLKQVLDKLPPSIQPNQRVHLAYCFARLVSRSLLYKILYRKE